MADQPISREESEKKRQLAYYQSLIDAEKNPSSLKALKLEQAKKRLGAVQASRATFDAAHPPSSYADAPPPSKMKWVVGALVLSGAGYLAYRYRHKLPKLPQMPWSKK